MLSLCMLQGMTELDAAGMATIKSLKRLRVLALSDLQLEPADADAVRAALPRLTDFSYEQVGGHMHLVDKCVHALQARSTRVTTTALHALDALVIRHECCAKLLTVALSAGAGGYHGEIAQ